MSCVEVASSSWAGAGAEIGHAEGVGGASAAPPSAENQEPIAREATAASQRPECSGGPLLPVRPAP